MKLSEIKTTKLLLAYLTEFVTKKANLEKVNTIVMRQYIVNCLKENIKGRKPVGVTAGLNKLSKIEGGLDMIREISKTVQDETIKKRFAKYLS